MNKNRVFDLFCLSFLCGAGFTSGVFLMFGLASTLYQVVGWLA